MLIGEFASPLGEKNRIALPKKLRDQFSGPVVITRGYEQCLLILDRQRWDNLLLELNKRPLLNMSVRDTKRYLLGGAQEIELDAQGRFVIPDSLVRFAQLEQEVVFVGVGEWAEVWQSSRWRTKLDELTANAGDIADRLGSI